VKLLKQHSYAPSQRAQRFALILTVCPGTKPNLIDLHLACLKLLQAIDAAQKRALEEALIEYPDNVGILNLYAWLLATSPDDTLRDGRRAIQFATRACESTGFGDPSCLDTLAAAYAETGDYVEAAKRAQQAISLLKNPDPRELEVYRKKLQNYLANKPTCWGPIPNASSGGSEQRSTVVD
jgi:hypothetical protein